MIYPTKRAVWLFAAGVPLTLMAIPFEFTSNLIGLAWLGFGLLALALDAALAMPPRALSLTLSPPPLLFVGDQADLNVTLDAPGWTSVQIDLASDLGANLIPQTAQSIVVSADGTCQTIISLAPRRRGNCEVRMIWLQWTGPFGLMKREKTENAGLIIPAISNLKAVHQAAIQFHARDSHYGIKAQLERGDGTEFEALREYGQGMDHRAIDWKHSARHRKLVAKEFRTERNHQIILAFDTGQLMAEPLDNIPRIDHAINAGLLLGYTSLRHGDRIGLYGFDERPRSFSAPVGNVSSFPKLQHQTAGLEYTHAETNYTLGLAELSRLLNRRALIIIFTEFMDTITAELMIENTGRLATKHLVLFVTLRDPALFSARRSAPDDMKTLTRSVIAEDFIAERRIVLEKLKRRGVMCLETTVQNLGTGLINQYLKIKQREMI